MTPERMEQVARDTWAAMLRDERRRRAEWAREDSPFPPGFPRTTWVSFTDEGDPRPDYQERAESWWRQVYAALDCDLSWWDEARAGFGAFDYGWTAAADWMEAHSKATGSDLWFRLNAALVEHSVPPGRGLRGPFYPKEWWLAGKRRWEGDKWVDDRRVPDAVLKLLPAQLEERMVFLSLTHIRGAMQRWKYRRDQGRSDEDFLMDCAHEMGTVWSTEIPWDGELLHIAVVGDNQHEFGWGRTLKVEWGNWSDRKRIKKQKIVALARRLFKVPTLYAAGVDESTGQAAFF